MDAQLQRLGSLYGEYHIVRYPESTNKTLRAWDAADEYLLDYLAEQLLAEQFLPEQIPLVEPDTSQNRPIRVLLVNDTFGALACALSCYSLTHWSDSVLSQHAVRNNFYRNKLASVPDFIPSTERLDGAYDVVVIKVPKASALLEDQLLNLRPHLHDNSSVVAAGMVRNLSRSSFQCFERILGPVTTSLAKKKARLIFPAVDTALVPPENPYPTVFTDAELGFPLYGYANVFSRQRLDAGARFFLTQFDRLPEAKTVVDLGCGNGVLGIAYQRDHPNAELCFIDESFMAIESAREGYRCTHSKDAPDPGFIANDGLTGFADDSIDLILCNPPFHEQHAIAEQAAHAMFAGAKRCLRRRGELWIVANRHLRYRSVLKRLFGQCKEVAAGPRFTLYRVSKQ